VTDDTPMPPALGTGKLTTGGQPPGSVVMNLPGVGMLRAGFEPEVNGRTGSRGMSSPRARLPAAGAGIAGLCTGASCFSGSARGSGGGRADAGVANATGVVARSGGGAGAATRGVVTWAGFAVISTVAGSVAGGAGLAATGTGSPLPGTTRTMR